MNALTGTGSLKNIPAAGSWAFGVSPPSAAATSPSSDSPDQKAPVRTADRGFRRTARV
jgi:hypothetical protein